ncbi:hypothetical protein [Methanobacterium paludis]|uniref:Uncharacterized protein n=1 Tax=Methanobacterium paludis (strain DSM 25820 / JCM 18151 / SWAN1) TaxID=868131 RepID=F6D5J5_METPW|nr:hypothetical protein [Methanobacterium paludis]AEG17612.1 hypothetical protein MSWAN_0574 [Methanobacterium paludis]
MKNYKGLKTSGILMVLCSLFMMLNNRSYGPIMMAFGIFIVTFISFKDKKQDITAGIIIAATLAVMLTLEYFLVPIQNTTFYMLLLIMSLGIFISFYFSLKPQNLLSKREKILAWTGSILGGISLFSLMSIIFNNFRVSLIIGVFTLIMIVFSLLIRRKISKEKALKDEFDEGFTTEKVEEYWFRYEIGGMPKPVRWQGWACYVIIFLSPFVVLIFDNDLDTAFVIILAIISVFIVISMLKSNYKENIMKYREDLKK